MKPTSGQKRPRAIARYISMNPLPYLPAALAAICAALAGLLFALSFVAWVMCEPAARRGPYRPRPWLTLTAFATLSAIAYALLP